MPTATKQKRKTEAPPDPFTAAMDVFYEAHQASYDVIADYDRSGKAVYRRMTHQEVINTWPPRVWWLSVETLIDQLFAIELQPWQLEPFAWLVRDLMLHGLDKHYAGEVGRRIDELKRTEDNTPHVKHEGVIELAETMFNCPGAIHQLSRMRGCTMDQAQKILNLVNKHGAIKPEADIVGLEAELEQTAVWPQDRMALEKIESDRKRIEDLKVHWDKRKRFATTESEDAVGTLDSLFK